MYYSLLLLSPHQHFSVSLSWKSLAWLLSLKIKLNFISSMGN
jgi:hypothetical protein